MSISVLVHWPDATEEEERGHPGFFNDDQSWVAWIVAVLANDSAVRRLTALGLDALLAYTTLDADPDAVSWVTPDAFAHAASGLRNLVQRGDPSVEALVEIYEANAPGLDKASIEFARDLGDVVEIAEYARGRGATVMALGYYA